MNIVTVEHKSILKARIMLEGRDWWIEREAGPISRTLREGDWKYVDMQEDDSELPLYATMQKTAFERMVETCPDVTIEQWIVAHELDKREPSVWEERLKVIGSYALGALVGILVLLAMALAEALAAGVIDPKLIAVVREGDKEYWVCVASWY